MIAITAGTLGRRLVKVSNAFDPRLLGRRGQCDAVHFPLTLRGRGIYRDALLLCPDAESEHGTGAASPISAVVRVGLHVGPAPRGDLLLHCMKTPRVGLAIFNHPHFLSSPCPVCCRHLFLQSLPARRRYFFLCFCIWVLWRSGLKIRTASVLNAKSLTAGEPEASLVYLSGAGRRFSGLVSGAHRQAALITAILNAHLRHHLSYRPLLLFFLHVIRERTHVRK